MSNAVLRGTSLVSSLTLVSRFFGFLRDIMIARTLGVGLLSDAFFVAFRLPNLARSLVAEGALTSAFVPTFASELKQGPERAKHCLRSAVSALSILSLMLVALGMVFAHELLSVFAPGILTDPHFGPFAVLLLRIMLPFLWCMSLVSAAAGALSSLGIFGSQAFAQVCMNILLIVVLFISIPFEQENRVIILSAGVLLGGVLQALIHIWWVRRVNFSLLPSRDVLSSSNREIGKLMIPAVGATAVYQLGILASTAIASTLAAGSISWLFYADRLAQLPLGVLSIALASVLLPALAVSEKKDFSTQLENALRFNLFLILPLSVFLFVEAESLIRLLFERGRFSSVDTLQTAMALQGYSLGLALVSSQLLLGRSFIADKDPLTPALCAALSLVVTILTAALLIGTPVAIDSWLGAALLAVQQAFLFVLPVPELPQLGHIGLSLAPASGALMGTFLLLIFCLRRGYLSSLREILRALWQVLLASVIFALALQIHLGDHIFSLLGRWALASVACGLTLAALRNKEFLQSTQLLWHLKGKLLRK